LNKQPKIYICNQLYNERELLLLKLNEIRLQLTKFNYEWKMIIVESNYTFTGNSKPYYLDEWIKEPEFKEFENNIIHIKMDGFGDKNIGSKETAMTCDFIQKCAVESEIEKINDEDIIVICDLDEIPDFRNIFYFFNNDLNNIDKNYTLLLKLYYYYYNCKALFEDDRVVITKKKFFKGVNASRAGESMGVPRIWIPNGGWHFSYLGGVDFIKNKISNFGHSELNTPEIQANIENNLSDLKDIYGRDWAKFKICNIDNSYPEYFLNNIKKFKHNIFNNLR